MEKNILLSSAYLAPVEYYTKLYAYDKVYVERFDHYMKQTYRNRCVIASASGPFFVFSRVHHPLRTLRLESQGGKGLNPAGIPYPGLSLLCALKKHHRRGFFSAEPEETKLRALSQECLKGCAGVHAGADKSFRPVRHGRGEEVRPAGEGAAHEQPVVVVAYQVFHSRVVGFMLFQYLV